MEKALDVLGKVSGVGRKKIDEIWKKVQMNSKTLEECVGPHEFQPFVDSERPWHREYKCTKCGGTIDACNQSWYVRGLIHGRLK